MTDEHIHEILDRMMNPKDRWDINLAQSDRAHLLAEVERLRRTLGEAFVQLVSNEETERMFDSDPDPDGDEIYWEISERALRQFAEVVRVDFDPDGSQVDITVPE